MSADGRSDAPTIPPIPPDRHRPRWSVMIPTFNCARTLARTLESVLAQDLGADAMQIEVVDDRSTLDDPEEVVRRVGGGRVAFARQERNGGVTRNFNTCIMRAQGRLVHILHGDDWVEPGFYAAIDRLAQRHPAASLYASRVASRDATGAAIWVSQRMAACEQAPQTSLESFWIGNPLQCAGIVVPRHAYEATGGFREDLVHTADWEMWTRLTGHGGLVMTPEVLASYRITDGNETGRLMRTAGNLHDIERLFRLWQRRYPTFPLARAHRQNVWRAYHQYETFLERGDVEAAQANREFWHVRAGWTLRCWALWRQGRRRVKRLVR